MCNQIFHSKWDSTFHVIKWALHFLTLEIERLSFHCSALLMLRVCIRELQMQLFIDFYRLIKINEKRAGCLVTDMLIVQLLKKDKNYI